jgi:hypothetical protein
MRKEMMTSRIRWIWTKTVSKVGQSVLGLLIELLALKNVLGEHQTLTEFCKNCIVLTAKYCIELRPEYVRNVWLLGYIVR